MKQLARTATEERIRLPFLDGIRGLAALYVVFSHILPHQGENLPLWISLPTKLIIYCTKIVIERKTPPLIMRVFEHPIAIALSTFSYSLYLTHGPVETLINHWLVTLNMSPVMFAVTLYFVSVGISLIFAYLFYLAFERPFMSGFLKKRKVKDAIS